MSKGPGKSRNNLATNMHLNSTQSAHKPCGLYCQLRFRSVQVRVKGHVVNTLGCSQNSVTVTFNVTSSSTGQSLSDVSAAKSGDLISLEVAVPFSAVSWAVQNVLSGKNIRGQCSMQHE
jgi:hypothetical protein